MYFKNLTSPREAPNLSPSMSPDCKEVPQITINSLKILEWSSQIVCDAPLNVNCHAATSKQLMV